MKILYGYVTRYFHDRKFGFIRGEDGNTYFVHHSKLDGEYIDSGYRKDSPEREVVHAPYA